MITTQPKISEDNLVEATMEILDSKYNGNFFHYLDAEKEAKQKIQTVKKLQLVASTTNLNQPTNQNSKPVKTTHIDFNKQEMTILEATPILGYSLDYLSFRRVLPFSLNTFLTKHQAKDLSSGSSSKEYDKKLRIINWVKERVLGVNFTVNGVSMDRSNGIYKFTSMFKEYGGGAWTQYISIKIDKDKYFSIDGDKRKVKDWNSYSSLFAYFMTMGACDIFCRCNCTDYVRKYYKKDGIGNYMCGHILYALAQIPYYLYQVV